MAFGAVIWGVQALGSAATLVLRRPWTSWLSSRRYEPQVRAHPLFQEANLVITGGWTGYFALAAATSAISAMGVSLLWAVPTPLLGWASFKAGDRYAARRLAVRLATTERMEMETNEEQRQLRDLIAGKSDEEILELASAQPGGLAGLVELTMAGMPSALDSGAAQDCVVGYEVSGPAGVHPYRIEVNNDRVTVERRSPDDARVVLQLSGPDFLRLVSGLLDGTDAFMTGKMRIRGDVMFAPQIARMFRTP